MESEIWKDITGYEGKYQVSNLGRIKSLPLRDGEGWYKRPFEKILTPVRDGELYYRVHLRRNGTNKRISVHRLVAEAFIPNPNGYKYVNHKDEDKTNNRADNLEWCSAKYNTNYGTSIQRRRETFRKNHGRAVDQFDLDWNFIRRFECISDVSQYGISPANVVTCCRGNNGYTQTGGYRWKYAD